MKDEEVTKYLILVLVLLVGAWIVRYVAIIAAGLILVWLLWRVMQL